MLQTSWVLATLVLSWASLGSCQVKYAVTGAQMFRPGTQYILSVTTFLQNTTETSGVGSDLAGTYNLTVRITSYGVGKDLVKKDYQLKTGTTEILTLNIPEDVPRGSYILYTEAFNGLSFNKSQFLSVSSKVHSLVIQTDKRLYKPGQTCKFRVIAFDPSLKPYKQEINITIYDTNSNKISKLVNKKNEYGVVTSELELSNITPLGKWKIVAKSRHTSKNQYFEVKEYVLPQFEVSVDAPENFFINEGNPCIQEDLKISVIAKYTYGKPVKGTANVGIKLADSYSLKNENKIVITKLLQLIDGKADTTISVSELKKILPPSHTNMELSDKLFSIDAKVTDTVTGFVLGGKTTVETVPTRLKLEFQPGSRRNYKPGLPYKAYVGLEKIDGSPADLSDLQDSQGNFRSLNVKITNYFPYTRPSNETVSSKTADSEQNFTIIMDKHGRALLGFTSLENTNAIYIKVSYHDNLAKKGIDVSNYINSFQTKKLEGIQLTLKNSSHAVKPGTVVYFNAETENSVDTIYFQMMAKGMIVLSKTIVSAKPTTSHDFEMPFTESMALQVSPRALFFVSTITDTGEIIADAMAINVEDYMVNKISLSFNKNETEPGDDSVILDVDTSADSYVGLLGVDQSVLLLHAGNDITPQVVSEELAGYSEEPASWDCFDCDSSGPIHLGGSETSTIVDRAGLFILTNLFIQKRKDNGATGALSGGGGGGFGGTNNNEAPVTVRKDFPETFIWTDLVPNSQKKVELKLKVPDTITSWVVTGFSVNQNLGLGISDSPAKLTVVKPFFVSLNLPYSIIRGEEFALQVTVNNYYGQDLEADVKLSSSEYFKVISCETKQPENADVVKRVKVANNDATAVYFWVVATSLGQIPIEVTASAGVAGDAMRAKLLVKPEGQPQSYSSSDLIQLNDSAVYEKQFEITFPPSGLVAGSKKLEMVLVGDMIGSSWDGIEDLLKMPHGCGEQNLVSFAPDVFIVNYLKATNQLTASIKDKALKFINAGYQRQLTYQRGDGSFSAFGEKDKAGSTWLSAFTIKCFHQAGDFIPVEDTKIARTLEWILANQAANGTFHEPPEGKVLHAGMQGGSASGLSMTAYVLISLLENKNNPHVEKCEFQESIEKATTFLEASYKDISTDSYTLAIISYALLKAESPELSAVLALLDGLAVDKDGLKHWDSRPEEETSGWTSSHGQPKSYDVELASYVLLVYARKKDLPNALPIAKWLLNQRNAEGGFASTQDTVLALEAITAFAVLMAPQTEGNGITVELSDASGTVLHTFDQVTRSNALILQSYELPEDTTAVTAKATGKGVALVQLIVNYNIDVEDKSRYLALDLTTREDGEIRVLNLTTSWNGSEVSGMVLVEVNLLTGFDYVDDGNLKTQIGETFKKLEKSPNKIVIYLDELTSSPLSFSLRLREILQVSKVKPALVKAYLYYSPNSVASVFYSSESGQTWEGVCPLCCPSA